MKDFNNLMMNGRVYSKANLLILASRKTHRLKWEENFYEFIKQWLNNENYITVQTSGSTGKPKILKLLKSRMIVSASMTCKFLNLKKGDTAVLCLSTKHIGGMMMVVRAFYAQLNLIVQAPSSNPLESIDGKIDFIAIVPYQAKAIITESPEKLKAITNIIIGGGKIDSNLEASLHKNKIKAFSTFGMTETISHIALQQIGQEEYYTCLDGVKIESSADGTLVVHAPNLLDTSLRSNDLVSIISAQSFKWLGRLDFAIESGGLKFIPEQIEQKLSSKISTRFIISSKPHSKFNNELILIIEGRERPMDKNMLEELDLYERPKQIHFVAQFKETENGKIDRIKTRNLV